MISVCVSYFRRVVVFRRRQYRIGGVNSSHHSSGKIRRRRRRRKRIIRRRRRRLFCMLAEINRQKMLQVMPHAHGEALCSYAQIARVDTLYSHIQSSLAKIQSLSVLFTAHIPRARIQSLGSFQALSPLICKRENTLPLGSFYCGGASTHRIIGVFKASRESCQPPEFQELIATHNYQLPWACSRQSRHEKVPRSNYARGGPIVGNFAHGEQRKSLRVRVSVGVTYNILYPLHSNFARFSLL